MNRALFLDLGGTLVRVENDEIFTDSTGNVEFLPNAVEILRGKAQAFDMIFVVTNQSGIEKGLITVETSNSFIDQVDKAIGGLVTDFWACPWVESVYRKPKPGMITGLADKHFVDLARSVMVGDSESDRKAAQNAGITDFVWADDFFER